MGESPKEDARGSTIDLPETLAECLNSLNCNEDSSARRRSPVRTRAPARILRPGGGVRGPPKPAASTARAPVGSRRDRSFARARSMRGARRPSPRTRRAPPGARRWRRTRSGRRRGPLEGPPRPGPMERQSLGLPLAPRVGPRCSKEISRRSARSSGSDRSNDSTAAGELRAHAGLAPVGRSREREMPVGIGARGSAPMRLPGFRLGRRSTSATPSMIPKCPESGRGPASRGAHPEVQDAWFAENQTSRRRPSTPEGPHPDDEVGHHATEHQRDGQEVGNVEADDYGGNPRSIARGRRPRPRHRRSRATSLGHRRGGALAFVRGSAFVAYTAIQAITCIVRVEPLSSFRLGGARRFRP